MRRLLKVNLRGQRFYQLENEEKAYPSVTTILNVINKPWLAKWQRKLDITALQNRLKACKELPPIEKLPELFTQAEGDAQLQETKAASFGEQAHSLIEKIIKEKNEDVECEPHLQAVKEGFLRWLRRSKEVHQLEFLLVEEGLVSKKHNYAGTCDAIAQVVIDGKPRIIVLDWKTSSSLKNDYALQIAAYCKAYEENYDVEVYAGLVIRFSKDHPGYEVKTLKKIDQVFEKFLKVVDVWQLSNQTESLFDASRAETWDE